MNKDVNIEVLKKMSQDELDILYGNAEAGPIPHGDSSGATLIFPGTPLFEKVQASTMVWGGKVFDCPDPAGPGTLINKVNGQMAFKADVYSYCLINKCYRKKSMREKRCLIKDVTGVG